MHSETQNMPQEHYQYSLVVASQAISDNFQNLGLHKTILQANNFKTIKTIGMSVDDMFMADMNSLYAETAVCRHSEM